MFRAVLGTAYGAMVAASHETRAQICVEAWVAVPRVAEWRGDGPLAIHNDERHATEDKAGVARSQFVEGVLGKREEEAKVLGNMVRTQMPLHTCKVNLRLATHSQHSPDNEQDDGLAHKVLPATMRKVRSSQTPDIAVDRVEGRQGDPCPRGQAQEHV